MFWRYTFGASSISKLLESSNVTVKEILVDNDFLSETRAKNSRLIDFFATEEKMINMLSIFHQNPEEDSESFRLGSVVCEAISFDVSEWNSCFNSHPSLYQSLWDVIEQERPHPLIYSYVMRVIAHLVANCSSSLVQFLREKQSRFGNMLRNIHLPGTVSCIIRMVIMEMSFFKSLFTPLLLKEYQLIPLMYHLIMDSKEPDLELRVQRSRHSADFLITLLMHLRQDFRHPNTTEWAILLELQNAPYLNQLVDSIFQFSSSAIIESTGEIERSCLLSQICNSLNLFVVIFDMERNGDTDGSQFIPHRKSNCHPWHSTFMVNLNHFSPKIPLLVHCYCMLTGKFPATASILYTRAPSTAIRPIQCVNLLRFRFLHLFASFINIDISLNPFDNIQDDSKVSQNVEKEQLKLETHSQHFVTQALFLLDEITGCILLHILWEAFEAYPEHNLLHTDVIIMIENIFFGYCWSFQRILFTQEIHSIEFNDNSQILLKTITSSYVQSNASNDLSDVSIASLVQLINKNWTNEFLQHPLTSTEPSQLNHSQLFLWFLLFRLNILHKLEKLFISENEMKCCSRSGHVRLLIRTISSSIDPKCSVVGTDSDHKAYLLELINSVMQDSTIHTLCTDRENIFCSLEQFKRFPEMILKEERFINAECSDPHGYGIDCNSGTIGILSENLLKVEPSELISNFQSAFSNVNDMDDFLNEMEGLEKSLHPPEPKENTISKEIEDNFPNSLSIPLSLLPSLPDISISNIELINYLRSESAENYPPMKSDYKYKEDCNVFNGTIENAIAVDSLSESLGHMKIIKEYNTSINFDSDDDPFRIDNSDNPFLTSTLTSVSAENCEKAQ